MESSTNNYIVIKDICHSYGETSLVLDNINLEIKTGLFGLLGANGAGKSTLMRIICTLLEPTSGQVIVGGYNVVKERQKARELLGYLPQDFGAWRSLTVTEVLETLGSLSKSFSRKALKEKVKSVLQQVGLSAASTRKVKHLSGGMLRRLGLAQALIHDPKILVLDEPTVGLDPEERLRFRQLIAELSRDRVVILSTHIVSDFGASCSDLVLIEKGQIKFRGSPNELISKAEGAVLELTVEQSTAEAIELSEEFEVINRKSLNGKSILRGIAKDSACFEGAVNASKITLEEAYLAFTMNQT